jgi:3-oxoacyl-[acyl-carrier-protein] synthase II
MTADSHDIVQPDPDGNGQARAARIAIERSGVSASDVVHVNAHATSTPAGDMAEAKWIAKMLGDQTMVAATKSMTGHLLGAAGAIEAIATVLSIVNDVVPPTINLDDPDGDLTVDVPREARKVTVTAALNDSFGFGGHNAALLFHKA